MALSLDDNIRGYNYSNLTEEDMATLHRLKFANEHDTSRLPIEKIVDSVLCGDCNLWLDRIPDKCLDMIYIDPPFFTRTQYETIWGNGWERAAWDDWKNSTKGDIDSFVLYMTERILKMKEKLKDTGTLWLHCDNKANYRFYLAFASVHIPSPCPVNACRASIYLSLVFSITSEGSFGGGGFFGQSILIR